MLVVRAAAPLGDRGPPPWRAVCFATASGLAAGLRRDFCREVDLTGRQRLLDLGGGSGAYSINAVQRFDGAVKRVA